MNSSKIRIVPPYPITHRFRVKEVNDKKTILELMAMRFPFKTEKEWEGKIRDGMVGVNNAGVLPSHIIYKGDEIFHHNPEVIEPSVPDGVSIIEETDDYMVVFKPAPMPMHPGGRYNKNSLSWILEERGYNELKIVHRLDAVTSGLVLFAKTKEFAQKATFCFGNARVKKTYFALVQGCPEEDEITIEMPIRRKEGFVFESEHGLEQAKHAITQFKVLKRGNESSIIQCNPITGRTHQIRLHLKKWGFPVIDDPVYGSFGDVSSERMQNIGISLLNAGLSIEELGIDYKLDIPEEWQSAS